MVALRYLPNLTPDLGFGTVNSFAHSLDTGLETLNFHQFGKKTKVIQQIFVQKNYGPISCTHYTLPNAKNCINTKFSNKLKQKSI